MPDASAEATIAGREANKAGDLEALLRSLAANLAVIVATCVAFAFLRRQYPEVYCSRQDNIRSEEEAGRDKRLCWWFWDSVTGGRLQAVRDHAGLDCALYIQFTNVAMRMLAYVGIPLLLVMSPLHAIYGGGKALEKGDTLSLLDLNNVVDGHWLWYLHAFITWPVTGVSLWLIHRAGKTFYKLRMHWLLALKRPRATCAMVDSIPEPLQTPKNLARYLNEVLGGNVIKIEHINFVRQLGREMTQLRHACDRRSKMADKTEEERKKYDREIDELRKNVPNTDSAFVHFIRRRHLVTCQRLYSVDDRECIEVSIPPDPAEIIWDEIAEDPAERGFKQYIGYVLLGGVFFLYVPLLLVILNNAHWDAVGGFLPASIGEVIGTTWDSLIDPIVLAIFMSVTPSIFIWIFREFDVMTGNSTLQLKLQTYNFWLLLIVVMFLTAIGSSLMETLFRFVQSPFDFFFLLAEYLPPHTHFFQRYFAVQWATACGNLLRIWNLMYFLTYLTMGWSRKAAKEKSEPEDQGSCGIGARSSGASMNLVMALTLCAASPLVTMEGIIYFAIERAVKVYLFKYAEGEKGDTGGRFYRGQLDHMWIGVAFYNAFMTGLIYVKTKSRIVWIIFPLFFVIWQSREKFEYDYSWEFLDMGMFEHLDQIDQADLRKARKEDRSAAEDKFRKEREAYMQPEFRDRLVGKLEKEADELKLCGAHSKSYKDLRNETKNIIVENTYLKANQELTVWESTTSWKMKGITIHKNEEMIATATAEEVGEYLMVAVRVLDDTGEFKVPEVAGAVEVDYVTPIWLDLAPSLIYDSSAADSCECLLAESDDSDAER